MGQFYNITNADKVSTWRSRYATEEGDDMQDWFLRVDGIDKPIKQTTKVTSPTPSGQTYGVMEVTMSKKGKEYYKFKRQEAPDDAQKPPETVQRTDTPTDGLAVKLAQLEQRVTKLEAVTAVSVREEPVTNTPKPDVLVDDDDPVDLSDIPF